MALVVSPPVWRVRFGEVAAGAAPAIAVYAVLRLLAVGVLAVFAERDGLSVWAALGGYDGKWYIDIALNGYDAVVPRRADGSLTTTNLAFFPLFPGLIALLDPVLPEGPRAAAITVSWLAGLCAASGLYAIGSHLRDRRTGIALAAVWAILPHAVVQSMAYTETLFTALAAWSLYALLIRRWLAAGALCLVAGLVRPTAAALAAAVGLTCLVAVLRRQDGWRPWLAGLLAPLGLVGYLVWVGHRLGRADGYFHAQAAAWGTRFDGGRYTLHELWKLATSKRDLVFYVVAMVLVVTLVLLALAIADRQPWPLLVYAGVVVATAFGGEGYYHSKARLVIPAFTVLIPVAVAVADARPRVRMAVLGTLTLISAWYGTYLCFVWGYSP